MIPPLLARLLVRTGAARWLPRVRRLLGGGSAVLHHYSDRLLASPWADLEALSSALTPYGPEVIDLAGGVPTFGAPSLDPGHADCRAWPLPDGLPALRVAVAEVLRDHSGLTPDPGNEVLICAGALGAVQIVFDAFVNRGDRVVFFDPSSPLYPLAARTRGARVRWLPSRVDQGKTRFRLDHLARSLRGARLLVLQSPANPTGAILAPEDLEQIAWWADKLDVLLLCDEVFARFAHDAPAVNIATLPRARARTLTVGSVSKTHALAGLRVGWLAADRHLLRPCRLTSYLRAPFASTPAQHLALAALRTAPAGQDAVRAELAARRILALERLTAAGFAPAWPAGGFFVWLPVPRHFAFSLLRDRQVRVAPGELFGPSGERYVRINLAAEEGRLLEGLSRLAAHAGGGRSQQERRAA